MKVADIFSIRFLGITFLLGLLLLSCQEDFLNVKPDKKLVVPHTLEDLQALLDNAEYLNEVSPGLNEVGAGDLYIKEERLQRLNYQQRNAYLWEKDIYEGATVLIDWDWSYRAIYYTNVVLEGLEDIAGNDTADDRGLIRGRALFYRAWTFYQLAQVFCKTYNDETAGSDPGIPLRLTSDINEPVRRATVQQTYDRIISDLEEAAGLLPPTADIKTRPSKSAAYALLAKTFLVMGDYENALQNINKGLNIHKVLLDYSSLDTNKSYPFDQFNAEVIFHSSMPLKSAFTSSYLNVDTLLYSSYHPDDLRKSLFFNVDGDNIGFKGSYDGSRYLFTGIASDELYLIKAECQVRLSELDKARETMSTLLRNRYQQGSTNIPPSFTDQSKMLEWIAKERRKELIFRGIKWSDLRRLNRDQNMADTLTRIFMGKEYILLPQSPRYALPIPDLVIQLSGIEQNPR